MFAEPLNGKKDDKPPARSIAGHFFDFYTHKCSCGKLFSEIATAPETAIGDDKQSGLWCHQGNLTRYDRSGMSWTVSCASVGRERLACLAMRLPGGELQALGILFFLRWSAASSARSAEAEKRPEVDRATREQGTQAMKALSPDEIALEERRIARESRRYVAWCAAAVIGIPLGIAAAWWCR